MGFAERNGFAPTKMIQIDDIDSALRNRLYNVIHDYVDSDYIFNGMLEYVVDKLGFRVGGSWYANWEILNELLCRKDKRIHWYYPYEVIELLFEAQQRFCDEKCISKHCECCERKKMMNDTREDINEILEQEKSGYRLLNGQLVKLTDENELDEVSIAQEAPYHAVRVHISKAVALYSDRKNPDYENSIKESISAVEAMCNIITGSSGAQATLGNALKKMEEDGGVRIHSAMKAAFEKLYGYASDTNGIRHGGIDFTNAPAEDAKYMLVSCSAFINYLIEKMSKMEQESLSI